MARKFRSHHSGPARAGIKTVRVRTVAIVFATRITGVAAQRNHFRLYNIALKNCFQRSDLYEG